MTSFNPIESKSRYESDDDWQDGFDDGFLSNFATSDFRHTEPIVDDADSNDETSFDTSMIMASGGLQPPDSGPQATRSQEVDEKILSDDDETDELIPDLQIEDDVDDDWLSTDEVEISYVVADFHGFVDQKGVEERAKKGPVRVRRPMSESPLLQLQGQLYSGKYRESDGTIMIMQKKGTDVKSLYKFIGTSNTILDVRQSFVFAKGDKTKKAATTTTVSPG